MSRARGASAGARLPARKLVAHRLKALWYGQAALDAALDDWLGRGRPGSPRARARAALLHRLLPERALRESPFAPDELPPPVRGRVRILSLIPPEDTGGGSRPARLAAELRRRGFAIDWRWALPIFPWPARRRPVIDGVAVRHVTSDASGSATPPQARDGGDPSLVLLEAPHPDLVRVARATAGRAPLVYDAIDVWDGALGAGWYDRRAEDDALALADHLIASARLLCDELSARTGRAVEHLGNAVDLRAFDPRIDRAPPADLRRGRPTVVYVGALWGDWVDLDLVRETARALPAATVSLIGPRGDRALPELPNVFALGMRPRSEIPAYLHAADVSIVPFVPDRLAQAVSPLKVFESLAMRCPVVATPLAELAGMPGVALADGKERFAAAVAGAPQRVWPEAEVARFLARHTWKARVGRILDIAGIG